MQDGKVIPLLLDIDFKEVSGPLAQFQAKKADHNDIKEMIFGINRSYSASLPEGQLEKLFSALWSELDQKINEIPKDVSTSKETRSQSDILEDLVAGVRTVEGRLREVSEFDPRLVRRGARKMHLGVFFESIHRVPPADPVRLLMVASVVRDDFPWIYELALCAFYAVKFDSPIEYKLYKNLFIEAVDFLRKGMGGRDNGL